jgi:hypothetical protein
MFSLWSLSRLLLGNDNNRRNCCFLCGLFQQQWGKLFILYTTVVNSVAMQQQSKCFLCGSIQGYITRIGLGSYDVMSYKVIIQFFRMELWRSINPVWGIVSCLSLDSEFSFGIRIEKQPVLGWRTKWKFNLSTKSRVF